MQTTKTLMRNGASGRGVPRPVRARLAPWQKSKVERYLEEHADRPLRTGELAKQVSLSVGHFHHAFKEAFGETPHVYVTRLRLELAQRLMLTTDDPLSQIAVACGMADQSQFTKVFGRNMGEPPGAWRRRTRAQAQIGARSRDTTAGQRAANSLSGVNGR
jgi:AraC family transcriptional regulator